MTAYFNGHFLGNNYQFQVENAYVVFMGFTAGYGYGLFCDTWAAPNTIDHQGPNAMIAVQNGIIDYRHKLGDNIKIGIGAEMPLASFTDAPGIVRRVNQRIPDVPVMIDFTWGEDNRIGAAAILRGLQYRNLIRDKNHTVCGWGVRISGNGTVCGPVGFFFQSALGKGIASYIQDLNDMGMDMVPDGDESGKMKPVLAYGLMGGLQYMITPSLTATAAYSHVRAYTDRYNHGATARAEMYSYGQYAVGNILWSVTPIVQCGVEYIYGRRVNIDGHQGHDNRLQTMLQVSF